MKGNSDDASLMVDVTIFGRQYKVACSENERAELAEAVTYLDQKMREISSGTLTVDSLKVAILAALHIADEFYQLKNVQAQNDAQLAARSAECSEMLDRILKHRDTPQEAQIEQ